MVADVTRDGKYVTPRIDSLTKEGAALSRPMQKGDLVIAVSGNPGLPAILETDACIHDGFVGLRNLDRTRISVDYLYCYLIFFKEQINNKAVGAIFKNLTTHQIADIEIPLPPLEEQRRIAAILDKADAVRRKRKEAIALTEELLRSAFLEMFGDPVTNPKGWEIVELEQVCHRVTDGTHQSPEWVTEGIPFLFVSNIVEGEIDFNVSKYISEESWASLTARCPIEVNDILYTTVGSYGNAALVRTEKRFCFQRHIAHIKPNSKKIHPEFLLGLMQSEGIKQQAERQVRGVAQKTLNLRELKKFQVAVPPRSYQEQYVAFQTRIEGCLNNQRDSFATQSNLFNSLLQRAFRGEL
jgi:type I restriction enzyme S subunit